MDNSKQHFLGKGRSGVVFLQTDPQGKLMATIICPMLRCEGRQLFNRFFRSNTKAALT